VGVFLFKILGSDPGPDPIYVKKRTAHQVTVSAPVTGGGGSWWTIKVTRS